jgi:histidinol phosphatase-like PHP family hydrolase
VTDDDHRRLDLLVLSDVHAIHAAQHHCPIPERRAGWGLELVRRVVLQALREAPLDAVVLLGDLVDNGEAPGAEKDLAALRDEVHRLGVPVLVVPGNHDGPAARVLELFGDHVGKHRLRGYQLITFADAYGPADESARAGADLDVLTEAAREHPEEPILALQHNPVWPPIDSTYPFNLTNARQVMSAYSGAGVLLSISGHYHEGLALHRADNVAYLTCPALCEDPLRYLRIGLRGRQVDVCEQHLVLPQVPAALTDFHAHTHYAYCADNVHPTATLERARAFGLSRIYFTEHAGQLYLSPDDYWGGAFRRDAGLIPRERAAGRGRMEAYRWEMEAYRSEGVRLGLEVELDADGEVTLMDQDREGWDLLIGAVHELPGFREGGVGAREASRLFMRDTDRIVGLGIDILAHPFRIFRRHRRPVPTELYATVADLLAERGVAAELNYHTNEPDPAFFEQCLERGVKVALGSDAHGLWEVGALRPHLGLLRSLVEDAQLPRILYHGRA